jgi:hypothetical protein
MATGDEAFAVAESSATAAVASGETLHPTRSRMRGGVVAVEVVPAEGEQFVAAQAGCHRERVGQFERVAMEFWHPQDSTR